jgi:hypothetical protein
MKIVINRRWGGFGVSEAVYNELGIPWDGYGYISNLDLDIESEDYQQYRAHPLLIQAIEKVGLEESSGTHALLKIVEIPDDVDWYIDDYYGMEKVHQQHCTWI